MDAQELRTAYVEFFKERGHAQIGSASLVPENDPTVLFTTAGMHPLVPYLLGEKHPMGKRLVNFQKCVRTGDIDEVGDPTHLTFFEMLGNWSLGDYFKEESIEYSRDFLVKGLGLSLDDIAVTVFKGEGGIPRDTETAAIWERMGIPKERIFYYGMEDNWWGPAGLTGPCGPDTEIFYDDGRPACGEGCGPACRCGKYVEIWNNVFMEYYKDEKGDFSPLKQRNVDTGMGLERVLGILQGVGTVYETTLFTGIISKIEEISGREYAGDDVRAFRIIADHVRAATFMLADGVFPARMGAGYIVRRLIRRASRYMSGLGYEENFMGAVADVVIDEYGDAYPELRRNAKAVHRGLDEEEERFRKTLRKGLRRFDALAEEAVGDTLDGEQVFRLFDTFGFPVELTAELARERGKRVDMADFENRFREHQDKSRAGADQTFKGGLADSGEETTKLHTATHLLHAALRELIDPGITQKGSNITAERLRFDFNFDRKITREELDGIEEYVNNIIAKDLPVECREMTLDEATDFGAIGVFGDKYGEVVKVYCIGEYSKELCGGPHVSRTSEIGTFKITKEESSAAGVRRIRAVVGK
ncbi:MAG: alanine--tRNA ligase [Thermoplasmatales archaeon]|nr:alanine--tRNA ligase [Thermoplasmatales archaeon]